MFITICPWQIFQPSPMFVDKVRSILKSGACERIFLLTLLKRGKRGERVRVIFEWNCMSKIMGCDLSKEREKNSFYFHLCFEFRFQKIKKWSTEHMKKCKQLSELKICLSVSNIKTLNVLSIALKELDIYESHSFGTLLLNENYFQKLCLIWWHLVVKILINI